MPMSEKLVHTEVAHEPNALLKMTAIPVWVPADGLYA